MRKRAQWFSAVLAVAAAAGAAKAEPAAPDIGATAEPFRPSLYLAAMVGTTVAYRPNGGSLLGPQHDLTPMAGIGILARETIAVELDLGPTMVDGEYAAFALVPGVVWVFDPHFYAAGRMIFTVDPTPNLALFPGLGVTHLFSTGVAPFVELNALSNVGQGEPDLGVAFTVGTTYTP